MRDLPLRQARRPARAGAAARGSGRQRGASRALSSPSRSEDLVSTLLCAKRGRGRRIRIRSRSRRTGCCARNDNARVAVPRLGRPAWRGNPAGAGLAARPAAGCLAPCRPERSLRSEGPRLRKLCAKRGKDEIPAGGPAAALGMTTLGLPFRARPAGRPTRSRHARRAAAEADPAAPQAVFREDRHLGEKSWACPQSCESCESCRSCPSIPKASRRPWRAVAEAFPLPRGYAIITRVHTCP